MSITAEEHSKRQQNGNQHHWVYYRCTKKGRGCSCSQPYVREEALAEEFRSMLRQISLPDDWVTPMLQQLDEWEAEADQRASTLQTGIRQRLNKIGAKLRRLNDLYLDEEIDRDEYRSRKAELVNEKIALNERKRQIARKGARV